MPRNLVPRPGQRAALDALIKENLIINLKTGGGKTLIAVLAVEHFLKTKPAKKIMLVVPTRVLVPQQAQYIQKEVDIVAVQEAVGGDECINLTRIYVVGSIDSIYEREVRRWKSAYDLTR